MEYLYSNARGVHNAFCDLTGQIYVGTGLEDLLTEREFHAFLLHEETHVRQHHCYIKLVVMIVANLMSYVMLFIPGKRLQRFLAFNVFGMLFSIISNWCIEILADRGASSQGYGEEMISGLIKLDKTNKVSIKKWYTTHPSTAFRAVFLKKNINNKETVK